MLKAAVGAQSPRFCLPFPWVFALTLHLSSLLLSQLLPRPPPSLALCQPEVSATLFLKAGAVFFTYCSLKIECDLKKVGVFKDIVVARRYQRGAVSSRDKH